MNYVTKKEFDERLDFVDQRFDAVDQRFDRLEFDLWSLKEEMKEGFAEVKKRFDQIFSLLDRDTRKTTDQEAEIVSAHSRIDRLESHLGLA